MLEFLAKYWSDLLVAAVGLSAFVVYFFEKRDRLRIAATLVLGQIDSVEKHISALKNEPQLGNIAVYHTQIIIKDNLWEQYKHLFVKLLNSSEYELIQAFYDNAEKLERSRIEIIGTITSAWRDKSTVEHQVIADIIRKAPENWEAKSIDFQSKFRPLDIVFTPDIAINALTKSIANFYPVSGTTAYQKIQKKSYK